MGSNTLLIILDSDRDSSKYSLSGYTKDTAIREEFYQNFLKIFGVDLNNKTINCDLDLKFDQITIPENSNGFMNFVTFVFYFDTTNLAITNQLIKLVNELAKKHSTTPRINVMTFPLEEEV